MKPTIIIGGGPAGVSASLYTVRAGIPATIITAGRSSLRAAKKIENYYGFPDVINGDKLYNDGLAGARRLGVTIIEDEVTDISSSGEGFTVTTPQSVYEARSIILAMGVRRNVPKIEGIDRFEGRGVSFCAVCDGFFYKNKVVAVIGSGEYAKSEARHLSGTARDVIIIDKPVKEIYGDAAVRGITMADGTQIPVDGVFIAMGTADSGALSRKLGVICEDGNIVVNREMETNIPRVYAAGDCTGGLLQIAKAVHEGAVAGLMQSMGG